jgi:hypothetical protein
MNERKEFTIEDGLAWQNRDLDFWKSVLHPAIYDKLFAAVMHANENLPYKTGYDVVRGTQLQSWVLNYHNEYKPF